jgi:hypothetical protein
MDHTGKGIKEVGLPGEAIQAKQFTGQAGDHYEEERSREDGDGLNIVGACPKHAPSGNDRVDSESQSRAECAENPKHKRIVTHVWENRKRKAIQ